jgi:hypothetical protein
MGSLSASQGRFDPRMWFAAVATIHHFGLDSGSHSKPPTRHLGCDIEGPSRAGGRTIIEPDERFSDCAGFARAPI